ncbi:MAG TPA: hypothetical protein VE987_05895 [Polyangiaceae bacterium]|nr:hypothetical protein [Polyangiaceae bacterium]
MSAWGRSAVAVGAFVAGVYLGGCAVESSSTSAAGSGGGWGSGSSGGAGGGSSTVPSVVTVDPDRTMTATPGEGVGVFTEYATGGHWHVWWTCDTSKTGLGCHFENTISAGGASVANVAGEGLEPSDTLSQPTGNQIVVTTQTSTGIDGVTFDATPGAAIQLEAKLDGVDDGALLFFVQDGVVNGGYTGDFADPLTLEPAAP